MSIYECVCVKKKHARPVCPLAWQRYDKDGFCLLRYGVAGINFQRKTSENI